MPRVHLAHRYIPSAGATILYIYATKSIECIAMYRVPWHIAIDIIAQETTAIDRPKNVRLSG